MGVSAIFKAFRGFARQGRRTEAKSLGAVGSPARLIASCGFAIAACAPLPAPAEEIAPNLSLDAVYTADALANVSGGAKTGAAVLGLVDVLAELDGAAIGWNDAIAVLDVIYTHGPNFTNRYSGDAQTISNIQADGRLKIYEASIAFPLAGENLRAKLGVMDINSEFDVQNAGEFFLNGSYGMGPDFSQSGENGPSTFPFTSAGAVLSAKGEGWSARFAVFDPVAGGRSDPGRTVFRLPGVDGALLVAEGDVSVGSGLILTAGGWTYTTRFDALTRTDQAGETSRLRSSRGAYGAIEGHSPVGGEAALDGWVRIGLADADVNGIGLSFTGGVVYTAGDHNVGIAVASARLGDPAVELARASGEPVKRYETVVELSYGWQMNERVWLQPDLQYVVNPSWRVDRDDALVVGLRLQALLF